MVMWTVAAIGLLLLRVDWPLVVCVLVIAVASWPSPSRRDARAPWISKSGFWGVRLFLLLVALAGAAVLVYRGIARF